MSQRVAMFARSPFDVASSVGDDETGERPAKKTISRSKKRAAKLVRKNTHAPDTKVNQCFTFFVKYLARPLLYVVFACIWTGRKVYAICRFLPWNTLQMIFGLGLCFFGGVYFVTIAAVEAARNFGGQVLVKELGVMYQQGLLAANASLEDDGVDANRDGIADVEQMSYNQYLLHKTKICMAAVGDPQGLMNATQYLIMTYTSVLSVLRFQFAKTISLCIAVADMLELPFVRFFSPLLSYALGPDLNQWVHPIISTTLKIIAVVVATYVQAMISAFYSGLRGGKLFAVGFINILGEYGIMDKLPGWLVVKPFDANESIWDEILAYSLAAAGFWFQFTHSFMLPFPYSLVLFPLTIVEWILRWQVFTGAW